MKHVARPTDSWHSYSPAAVFLYGQVVSTDSAYWSSQGSINSLTLQITNGWVSFNLLYVVSASDFFLWVLLILIPFFILRWIQIWVEYLFIWPRVLVPHFQNRNLSPSSNFLLYLQFPAVWCLMFLCSNFVYCSIAVHMHTCTPNWCLIILLDLCIDFLL